MFSSIDPIENVEQLVEFVRAGGDRASRKSVVLTALRGKLDYSTAKGAAIGTRRALLCTRLREEGLDDVFLQT